MNVICFTLVEFLRFFAIINVLVKIWMLFQSKSELLSSNEPEILTRLSINFLYNSISNLYVKSGKKFIFGFFHKTQI